MTNIPQGAKCGSIYIDRAFKRWLMTIIGSHNYQKLDPNSNFGKISSHAVEGHYMRALMKMFDSYKQNFCKGFRDIRITLPEPSLKNLKIPEKVNDGEFTITKYVWRIIQNELSLNHDREQMRKFFDPSVNKIVDLVKKQMSQIRRRNARTNVCSCIFVLFDHY